MGSALGAVLIVLSILGAGITGGFSLIGIVPAVFLFGGQQAENRVIAQMEAEPEHRDATFFGGCVTVLLGGILTLFIVYLAAYLFLGGTL